MKTKSRPSQLALLVDLRKQLEPHFGQDTACPGTCSSIASAGHCAAVSAIAMMMVGGEPVSASVNGTSHWFNRVSDGRQAWDVDLTGDQFGFPATQYAPAGKLYSGARIRGLADLNLETLQRAMILSRRSGLGDATAQLGALLRARRDEALAVHA